MIELTEDQRRQLANGHPVDGTDQQTAQPYVVRRQDVYDRFLPASETAARPAVHHPRRYDLRSPADIPRLSEVVPN
jgi:hypothetical protein